LDLLDTTRLELCKFAERQVAQTLTMDVRLGACLDSRFQSLILNLFDAEQYRSALFWSERYFCHDRDNHPARHLYALSLLHNGQTQSALNHVNQQRCHECTDIYAKCCVALGRYGQAKDALESIARGEGTTTKGARAV
jgi:anaphase-promoting complex subunit 3